MSVADTPVPRRAVPRIVANWKMRGSTAAIDALVDMDRRAVTLPVALAICPPATLIAAARARLAAIAIGAQDVHGAPDGPFTGAISAGLAAEAGATFTIIGHVESRARTHPTPADLAAQIRTALSAGLDVLLCVGDVADLLACLPADTAFHRLSIAYEPPWAIGGADAAPIATISAMHDALRTALATLWGDAADDVPILYGGAVDAGGAAAILAAPQVDGVLIGRASLPAATFAALVDAATVSAAPLPLTELPA